MDNSAMKLLLARVIFGSFIVIVAAILIKTIAVGGSLTVAAIISGFIGIILVAAYLTVSKFYS